MARKPASADGEYKWMTIRTRGGAVYTITSKTKTDRDTYTVWRSDNGTWTKLGSGKNPRELESKYITG